MVPADPGLDDEIVLLGAVAVDRAVGHLHSLGANAAGFRQNVAEIAFGECEGSEPCQLRLLSAQPAVLLPDFGFRIVRLRTLVRGVQYCEAPGEQSRGRV